MKHKIISKNKLIKYRWYVGRGRNNNVGYWDGNRFLTLSRKFGQWDIKDEPYYTKTGGCFQPFLLIDEGEVLPFGNSGWDLHYGKVLITNKTTLKKKVLPIQFQNKHSLDIEALENIIKMKRNVYGKIKLK